MVAWEIEMYLKYNVFLGIWLYYVRLSLVLMITLDTILLIRIFSMSRFSTGCETLSADKDVAKYSDIIYLAKLYVYNMWVYLKAVLKRLSLRRSKNQKINYL